MLEIRPQLLPAVCFSSCSLLVLSLNAVRLQLLKVSEKSGFIKCLLSSQYDKIRSYHISLTRQTAPAPAVGIVPHLPTCHHIKQDVLFLIHRMLSSYKILFTRWSRVRNWEATAGGNIHDYIKMFYPTRRFWIFSHDWWATSEVVDRSKKNWKLIIFQGLQFIQDWDFSGDCLHLHTIFRNLYWMTYFTVLLEYGTKRSILLNTTLEICSYINKVEQI